MCDDESFVNTRLGPFYGSLENKLVDSAEIEVECHVEEMQDGVEEEMQDGMEAEMPDSMMDDEFEPPSNEEMQELIGNRNGKREV